MKYLLAIITLVPTLSFATFSGKLDLSMDVNIGAWQSVTSPDQAYGVSKRLWTLDKDGHDLLVIGGFGGVQKPLLSDPGASPVALGGLTVAVPGSLLDFTLGTKMGDTWAPRLKTGVLVGYDLSRPKMLHWNPGFIGVGASYGLGGS